MEKRSFYITTPIYYVNDRPHIGHAYTLTACDVLARAMRMQGYHVKFLTGTDEHGQKVEKSAAKAGVTPKALADANSQHFRDLAKLLKVSNDDFIRTTEPRHVAAAQAMWNIMLEKGYIYLGSYAGWYAVRDEAFYAESELVEGKAPTGAEVEWVEEPSYFFKLSAFTEKLLKFYEEHPDYILPTSRRNEVISFVKGGLKDLSISRTTFSWGIPVPGDPKHIMYVWLDALVNYLSAVGFPDQANAQYKQFWPAMHMVGKDILRFHAVYWPAFLMAADLPLPHVFAHGWLTIEGEKMSKSLGNVIAPTDLIDQFGLDQSRFFLLRAAPFGNDFSFSYERMTAVINSELANTIGNLVQRTISMVHKNCEGKVPDAKGVTKDALDMTFLDKAQVTDTETPKRVEALYRECRFNEILGDIVIIAQEANQYIDTKAPWKQKKEDPKLMEATLYHLLEGIRCIAIMLQPFVPTTAVKMLTMLGYDEAAAAKGIGFDQLTPQHAIKPGTALGEAVPLFPRIEN